MSFLGFKLLMKKNETFAQNKDTCSSIDKQYVIGSWATATIIQHIQLGKASAERVDCNSLN